MFSLRHKLICHIRQGWLICRGNLYDAYRIRKQIKENIIPSQLNKLRRYFLRLLSMVQVPRSQRNQRRDVKTKLPHRRTTGSTASSPSVCLRDVHGQPRFDGLINTVLSTPRASLEEWLVQRGIQFVSAPDQADITVIDIPGAVDKLPPDKKKYLLTMEPRNFCDVKTSSSAGGQSLLVSNCYTNTLLTSNYACFPYPWDSQSYPHNLVHYPCRRSLSFSDIEHKWHHKRKVLFTARHYHFGIKFPPGNIMKFREHFALYGVVKGIADMVSRDYYLPRMVTPEKEIIHNYLWGMFTGGPFVVDWTNKIEWLRRDYLFSTAFENSLIPYYVTEKLWMSFWGYSLPIYYSNDTVYETFPKDCIIDYRDFNSKDDLYEYIMTMSAEEYLERLNIGLAFVNDTAEHTRRHNEWRETAREHIYNDLIRLAKA